MPTSPVLRRLVLAISLAVSGIPAGALARSAGPVSVPTNCSPGRPAAAYHAGSQRWLSPQPASAPVPCGSSTGLGAVESRIAVSATGVVFSPATSPDGSTTGVASSGDQGQHWALTGGNGGIDDNLSVDPRTGRIYWVIFNRDPSNPTNHELAYSDNGGRSWTLSRTGACCVEGENSRLVTAAPAPGLGSSGTPNGYPDVVYVCSDTSLVGGAAYPAGARVCSRSLDGGASFGAPTVLFSKPVPQHPECVPYGGEYFAASEGAYPQAGPDGVLYTLVHCGTDHVAVTYLGRSVDEARSWQLLGPGACSTGASGPQPMPNGQELRVDTAGNLYVAWTRTISTHSAVMFDDSPVLQVSRDRGCHWSAPVRTVPPGVVAHSHHPEQDAFQTGIASPYWPEPLTDYSWFMDVAGPGHVAVDFYGTTQPSGAHFDAYMAETLDALDPDPVFWAAQVNPPSVNMRAGAYADEYTSGNEHVGLSIGPDDSPWGSFTDGTKGWAGRLVWLPPQR